MRVSVDAYAMQNGVGTDRLDSGEIAPTHDRDGHRIRSGVQSPSSGPREHPSQQDRSSPPPVSDEEPDGSGHGGRRGSFVYQDYSQVKNRDSSKSFGSMLLFGQKLPAKLNTILADPETQHIVSWMGHGRAWRVHDPDAFVKEVMPRYFQKANWNSFVRLINAWGFRRMLKGPDRNAYYHELFLRGMPHLHEKMHRFAPKQKKAMANPESEPNFYDTSKFKPLGGDEGAMNVDSSDISEASPVGVSNDFLREDELSLENLSKRALVLRLSQQLGQSGRKVAGQRQETPSLAAATTAASARCSLQVPPILNATLRQLALEEEEEEAMRMAVEHDLASNRRRSINAALAAGVGPSGTTTAACPSSSQLHTTRLPVEPLLPTSLPTTSSGIRQRRLELRLAREELELQLDIIRRQQSRLEMLASDLTEHTTSETAATATHRSRRPRAPAPVPVTPTLNCRGTRTVPGGHHATSDLQRPKKAAVSATHDVVAAAAVAARRGSKNSIGLASSTASILQCLGGSGGLSGVASSSALPSPTSRRTSATAAGDRAASLAALRSQILVGPQF